MYVWGQDASVYRGQWRGSMMDGCGVRITRQPNGSFLAEEGQFVGDDWVSFSGGVAAGGGGGRGGAGLGAGAQLGGTPNQGGVAALLAVRHMRALAAAASPGAGTEDAAAPPGPAPPPLQVGDVMACTVEQARAAAAEADSAAQMARVFEVSGMEGQCGAWGAEPE